MSLNLRVLVAASAVLATFFGVAGFTLDRSYQQSAEEALVNTLQGHVFTLIASAGLDDGGQLHLPEEVPDTRFSSLGSGLFAQVTRNNRDWRWQSVSMKGMDIPFTLNLDRIGQSTRSLEDFSGRDLYLFSYGVVWGDTPELAYTFSVAQDLAVFNEDILEFRQSLWGALGGVAVILLAVQGLILRWGLSPLKHASEELSAIEAGTKSHLGGDYPQELQGLTGNINALLSHQHEHLDRYRKSLGDLAHSLKTPLAVLQNAVANGADDEKLLMVVREQVERMNQITGYQLRRAATAGWTALAAPVPVAQTVDKILKGLKKVYADKDIQVFSKVANGTEFHGDEGDLLEIIGNLADNACKWCQARVSVFAENQMDKTTGEEYLCLRVEDDGPGLPREMQGQEVRRGQRADSSMPGHGIGLSIVQDIVRLYGGRQKVSTSEWGGASILIYLPIRRI